MLQVGDPVPDFTLPLANAQGSRAPVAFRDLLAHGPVVLSFYPLAFTGVCTSQVCEMRDAHAELAELGVTVAGFSIDAHASNAAFAREHGIPYGLYSDPNREVLPRIWEMQTVAGVKDVAKRGWMVVGADGRVAALWITDIPTEWSGLAPVRDALRALAPKA